MPALRVAKLAYPIAALLLAAGCDQTIELGSSRTLRIALEEYRLNPQSVHARTGALTILARNFGRLTHNLVISRDGQPDATTKPLGPGQSGQITILLAPGSYQMGSTILSDQALGAYGTLTVTR